MAPVHIIRFAELCSQQTLRYLGGINTNGTHWKATPERIINGMENGWWAFQVAINGAMVSAAIAADADGNKRLIMQGDLPDLPEWHALPPCPDVVSYILS